MEGVRGGGTEGWDKGENEYIKKGQRDRRQRKNRRNAGGRDGRRQGTMKT